MSSFVRAMKLAAEKYPQCTVKQIQYGTAGFRSKATELAHVMYRMGLLAVLRSKARNAATIGVMITASHNPEDDNGVKLVDPHGEMLEASWEDLATHLANVKDDQLDEALQHIVATGGIDLNLPGHVFFARDTRPSSLSLSQAVSAGVDALQGVMKDYDLLTTPQLHYMICCKNTGGQYGDPTEEGYYKKLTKAFIQFHSLKSSGKNYSSDVMVDGANGVGALKLKALSPYLEDTLRIEIYNDGSQGKLNHNCGADFVKVQQKPPEGLLLKSGCRYASFDGDADRLVYFYLDNSNEFHLLDGDKIATLVTGYLQELVKAAGISLNLCVVQTAYANGSSTTYIKDFLKVPAACVPTGVKHLHHRAQQADIGVYFEANGHGTVLFSKAATNTILKASKDLKNTPEQQTAAQQLMSVMNMINQTVGDAISDLLLVETILYARDWTIKDWDALYNDLPNRQLKVKVADRSVITTTDAERICVEPSGLQEAINNLVEVHNGRAFIRPSGTEDIVRVYAEADTQTAADNLAQEVSKKVFELAGGVEPSP